MKQQIAILGATGSIGGNTLDVIARHPERYAVFAVTAATKVEAMVDICRTHRPRFAVMTDVDAAEVLRTRLAEMRCDTEVLAGPQHLVAVAQSAEVDVVMAAIVGSAGLPACMAAAHAGKRLLLANKEALVVGGDLFMQAVRTGGATLLPIDSEHSAVFQSLPQERSLWASSIDKIILTASGGPFRDWDPERLPQVTPEQACAHPNWVMGRKISVDSATMMNKALEVIEARYLFDVEPACIEVVIHPQSVVHSMVQFVDNSVVAQLGTPDMRVPIAYGLSWPERMVSGAAALDFASMGQLTFSSADSPINRQRYPGLRLAWEAMASAPGTTAVLNAANEVAVDAFLTGQVRFDQIHAINLHALESVDPGVIQTIDDVLALDRRSRVAAQSYAKALQR
ncbi:1-deoxy-D-xylulose-5-phosphate reductoisomerase [Curvibacter sp. APW13]|uniref:1-deoxy-D-xylulose-5-phosphate reductoisomerase n=1 Tax=Curvibacter sp. APW13 TaxID=3077236 RepID=UPI0028E059EB|nr:1-deoxy-D-xylulose-5-phosphate reductoisomerase [Curvibacter sp. APW13]MDT8992081.1 1-deoxy-D-xylulose-5-phosphate reductoisomerase [Curvibacter sp. APW13]